MGFLGRPSGLFSEGWGAARGGPEGPAVSSIIIVEGLDEEE